MKGGITKRFIDRKKVNESRSFRISGIEKKKCKKCNKLAAILNATNICFKCAIESPKVTCRNQHCTLFDIRECVSCSPPGKCTIPAIIMHAFNYDIPDISQDRLNMEYTNARLQDLAISARNLYCYPTVTNIEIPQCALHESPPSESDIIIPKQSSPFDSIIDYDVPMTPENDQFVNNVLSDDVLRCCVLEQHRASRVINPNIKSSSP